MGQMERETESQRAINQTFKVSFVYVSSND